MGDPRTSVLSTVLATLLTSSSAGASVDWLRLERAPGARSCDDENALAAAIDRQLGRSAGDVARRARVSLRARIARQDAGGFKAELTVVDADGDLVAERAIAHPDATCAASMEALAVVAALLLEKEETREADAVPPAAPAPRPVSPPPPPSPSAAPAPEPEPTAESVHLVLSGGAVVAAGLLPRGALGAGGAFWVVGPSRLGGYVALSTWAEQKADVGSAREIGVGLTEVGLGACWASADIGASRALSACLGADVGRLSVKGIGFASAASETRWTVDAMAGAWLHQPLSSSFELALGARLKAPLVRDSFDIVTPAGETQTAFRLSTVAILGDLGLGYAFP